MSPNNIIQYKEQTFLVSTLENQGEPYVLFQQPPKDRAWWLLYTMIIIKLFTFQHLVTKKSKHPIPIVRIGFTKG